MTVQRAVGTLGSLRARQLIERPELGAVAAAVVLFFFFAIASRGAMFEPATVARILDTAWPMGIVAIAMGMLIVGGEFDLSVGVMIATAGTALGVMSTVWGMHLGVALPLSLVLCLAIARAMHFGARLLILDEPTSALGVRQSAAVLQLIRRVADRGTAVVFVTPQPRHAYLIGDRFIILQKGGLRADLQRGDLSLDELTYAMAGGRDVQELELTVGDE